MLKKRVVISILVISTLFSQIGLAKRSGGSSGGRSRSSSSSFASSKRSTKVAPKTKTPKVKTAIKSKKVISRNKTSANANTRTRRRVKEYLYELTYLDNAGDKAKLNFKTKRKLDVNNISEVKSYLPKDKKEVKILEVKFLRQLR